jgi:hypothetical protein
LEIVSFKIRNEIRRAIVMVSAKEALDIEPNNKKILKIASKN